MWHGIALPRARLEVRGQWRSQAGTRGRGEERAGKRAVVRIHDAPLVSLDQRGDITNFKGGSHTFGGGSILLRMQIEPLPFYGKRRFPPPLRGELQEGCCPVAAPVRLKLTSLRTG